MREGKFRAAAVQASSVFMDKDATVAKAVRLIDEAADNGASVIVFPEVFIPGYPIWGWLDTPLKTKRFFRDLLRNSVHLNGPELQVIGDAARRRECYVLMGLNELGDRSDLELYNTSVLFDDRGEIVLRHRKTMPTWAEKLTWGFGDGSSLRVVDSKFGRLGALNCGENGHSLLRYALIAQGEQVHFANYAPALAEGEGMYLMSRGVEVRSAAHSFEGKLFTIVASGMLDADAIEYLSEGTNYGEALQSIAGSFSAVLGPDGGFVGGPSDPHEECIVYGDIDLDRIIDQKMFHDIAGNYTRPDIVSLQLNANRNEPLHTFLTDSEVHRFGTQATDAAGSLSVTGSVSAYQPSVAAGRMPPVRARKSIELDRVSTTTNNNQDKGEIDV